MVSLAEPTMLKIDVSTHPESADKIVRLVLAADDIPIFIPLPEWSQALANVGQFSPDKPDHNPPVEWVEIV